MIDDSKIQFYGTHKRRLLFEKSTYPYTDLTYLTMDFDWRIVGTIDEDYKHHRAITVKRVLSEECKAWANDNGIRFYEDTIFRTYAVFRYDGCHLRARVMALNVVTFLDKDEAAVFKLRWYEPASDC